MKTLLKPLDTRIRRLGFIDFVLLQAGMFCLAMLLCKLLPPLRKVDYRRWLRGMLVCYGRPLLVLTRR